MFECLNKLILNKLILNKLILNKLILNKLIVLLIIVLMFASSVLSGSVFAGNDHELKDNIKITINETNLVKKPYIFLKDIAVIQASEFIKEALDKVELGRSPKPGEVRLFSKNKILSIVKQQRYLPDNIILSSPERVYVKRLSQRISKQKIRQFVEKHFSNTLKNRDYKLETLHVKGLEQYPAGKIKLHLDSTEIINNNGKINSYINVIIDGKQQDRLNISGEIALYENIFFAQNHLARGDIISQDCVYQAKKNIYTLREGFIKTYDELDGKMVKSSIRKGDNFKRSVLIEPPLINKGDIIQLVIKNNNLLITASGISMENGFENELIKVENIGSGKLVRGIVKEKSKVEVIY